MKRYALYDVYDAETPALGELLCESDDIAEIKAAENLRQEDTDGECDLRVVDRLHVNTTVKLKACPFCGEKPIIFRGLVTGTVIIVCRLCGAVTSFKHALESEEKSAKLWNARAIAKTQK